DPAGPDAGDHAACHRHHLPAGHQQRSARLLVGGDDDGAAVVADADADALRARRRDARRRRHLARDPRGVDVPRRARGREDLPRRDLAVRQAPRARRARALAALLITRREPRGCSGSTGRGPRCASARRLRSSPRRRGSPASIVTPTARLVGLKKNPSWSGDPSTLSRRGSWISWPRLSRRNAWIVVGSLMRPFLIASSGQAILPRISASALRNASMSET